MLAYLAMMAPRLMEMRRVLKETGSIYLHCDPTASHYLKLLMDGVFGAHSFLNEIVWQRINTKSDYKQGARNWPRVHDVLLTYRKHGGAESLYVQQFRSYDPRYLEANFRYSDENGRYSLGDLSAPGRGMRGHPQYEFLGVTRFWRFNKAKMQLLYKKGLVTQTKPGTIPRLKRYLKDLPGVPIPDTWTDIGPVQGQSNQFLGYPTQKPEALLERIIEASSNEGDVVLDPFCGCGTAVAAAEKLNRRWLGIDITHLAVNLMKQRLLDSFGIEQKIDYAIIGEPESLSGARQLAKDDAYQFQYWALGLVGARPHEKKKGADHGIDGQLRWIEDAKGAKSQHLIISVKSGKNVSVAQIRDLVGTIDREKAAIGVYITLTEPTKPMKTEAASAGFFENAWGKFPRIQLLTIQDLFDGKRIEYPMAGRADVTFAKAPRVKTDRQSKLHLKDK